MNKIAFLFLTIDNLKHSSTWAEYFNGVDKKKYNVYVHSKYPDKVSDDILKENIIDDLVGTKHGFLVEAMVKLMDAGLKDKDNKFFVFASDSCVPIKQFDMMYDEVFKIGKSIVGKMFLKRYDKGDGKKSGRYGNAAKKVKKNEVIPKKCYSKFSQWSILIRGDVEKVVGSPYLKFFYAMDAGDEFYLSILKCPTFDYSDLPATYVDWAISDDFGSKLHKMKKELETELKKYNYGVGEENRLILRDTIHKLKVQSSKLSAHPREFHNINQHDINLLKNSKAFFARKFTVDSNIGEVIDKIW
jgi:hypothetical protein